MDVLLDAITRAPGTSVDEGQCSAGLRSVVSNTEGFGLASGEQQAMEAGTQLSRKRVRRLSGTAPTLYECRICHRTYERADRLSRHMKTHENARRHPCQRCPKSFNRADLLSRHQITHTRSDLTSSPGHGSIQRTNRAGQACVGCAAAKARCEDQKPCRRCQTKGMVCEVPGHPSWSGRRQMSEIKEPQSRTPDVWMPDYDDTGLLSLSASKKLEQQQHQQKQKQQPQHPQQHHLADDIQLCRLTPDTSCHSNDHTNDLALRDTATDYGQADSASVGPMPSPLAIYDMHDMHLDDTQLIFDNIMNEILFMPNAADFNNQNLDINFHNYNFQDAQLDTFPAPSIQNNNSEFAAVKVIDLTHRHARDIRAGYAAFTRSPWLWTPAHRDRILRDDENLTLNESSITSALTPRSSGLAPNVPSCGFPTITAAMRDKMYHLVSTMNRYSSRIPGFPSLDVINHVVEAFFVGQTYQVDNWIHVPSMTSSDFIPELGLALVVAGSTVILLPAIGKMGLVLQDVVRVKLGELFDRENNATRKLQPLQAWILALDAGLWSGFQRQQEVAESFGQTIITMMRRGGMFGAIAETQALIPHESDTGQVLEAKWNKWVQKESFKRLCLHLFFHDTRASIALQKFPLISITEITISLPASRMLFLAGSAMEWKSCFQEQRSHVERSSLQLTDVMCDIGILDELHSEVDVSLCCMAVIHGFWSQIWAFRDSWKFHAIRDDKDSAHRLWLMTQQRELYQQVENVGLNLLDMQVPKPELLIVVELLLMILYISPEELQRFAGKYGEDAASQAFLTLEQWAVTNQSRRAVWHAGQVFRWASLMPAAELRDFYAIAVYFASLTLWAYGHVSSSRETLIASSSHSSRTTLEKEGDSNYRFFVINSEDISGGRHAYISGRYITPVLTPVRSSIDSMIQGTYGGKLVRLDDPNAVLQVARDLYRSNFPVEGESLPPLVENMGNLMRDLGSFPENRFSRCASPMERGDTSQERPTTSGWNSGSGSISMPSTQS